MNEEKENARQERGREALRLRQSGLKLREIGEALGVGKNRAHQLVNYGRRLEMRDKLREDAGL
jgi:DNA-directed RNA polymerase specialized sigma24 family protein